MSNQNTTGSATNVPDAAVEQALSLAESVKLDVSVYPIAEPQGSTLAFASVKIDDLAVIRGIRIVAGENGLFMSMPQSKGNDGKYHDTAFPSMKGLHKQVRRAVLEEYKSPGASKERNADLVPQEREAANVKLDVQVYPISEPMSSTLAFASVSIDDKVVIRGVRVVAGEDGRFVSMPQTKGNDGKYHSVAFPALHGLRKELNKAVLNEYRDKVKSLVAELQEGKARAAEHIPTQKTPAMARSAAAIA